MSDCIDIHTHIVPESFPPYVGRNTNVPWPSMADAQACHKHVMISGKVYRTVSDGCWSVPRRIEDMAGMRVTRQALSPMPELLSYWLALDDAKVMVRYLNDQIAVMVAEAPGRFIGLGGVPLQDIDAALAELDYCVKTFGQWPVTYNPMQAHFGAVIHNVDEEFYDTYYKTGYVTDQIRNRSKIWGD